MIPEFQVVVLAAGKGSRITELTSKKAKCLLPIGNMPMVYYPLKLLEKSGFKDVFLVVLETAKSDVESALDKTDLSSINVIIITIPCDTDSTDWGTADSLRYISPHLISDFIVVSCDLLTTFDIRKVLNFHRKNDAALTALYFHPFNGIHFTNPGAKSKNKIEKDLIGIDPVTNRLVFLASASDYEDVLPLKKKLLQKYGSIRIYTKLLDAHFFVMKKWMVEYLSQEKNLTTIKGELLPNILKKELSNENKLQKVHKPSPEHTSMEEFSSEKINFNIFSLARSNEFDTMARSMSSYNDHDGDLYPVYMNDYMRSYAFIADESFGIRNNTLHDYCKSNRTITNYWKDIVNDSSSNISSESDIQSTQLEKDTCFIDAQTKIAAKTSIKTSSIGRGCVIENKTRISDCVIMNNVTIREGCVLQNCVICDDVIIEANCNIKDSVIGSQHSIPAKSTFANEVLVEIESLMEV